METLKKFKKQFVGSSFPVDVETNRRPSAIIKMAGSGNGPQSLIAEFIVNHMCARAGMPVPDVFVVDIPKDTPWDFGTDEFDDIVQRSFGPNLGIDFIEDAKEITDKDVVSAMPEEFLKTLVTVDSFFRNYDRTDTCFNLLADKNQKTWLTDHGSCAFLDSQGLANSLSLPSNHFLKAQEDKYFSLDLINKIVTEDSIKEVVGKIPQEWIGAVNTDSAAIEQLILGRRDHYLLNIMIRF